MLLDFKSINLKSFYSTTGHRILREVISPVLEVSRTYDRLTGYFSVGSLKSVASGLESIYRAKGRMRLVIGIHDVDKDLITARELGNLLPENLVEHYKQHFLTEIGSLSEVTERSAIAGIAWMLRLGFLEIRVASPKNKTGIYHQKRMIFRDASDNVIAGTGSLNETVGGLYNVEEMQFSFSWKGIEDLTNDLVESFEKIWNGKEGDVDVVPLDEAFATEILERLNNLGNPYDQTFQKSQVTSTLLKDLFALVRKSPSYTPFNLSHAALYPHQERVFTEALSRWPIRILLADEVGLGKTLEAGVVISYMLRMQMVDKVTILCPASLMRQWQEEMQKHFNLEFYYFDSGRNEFVSPDKLRIQANSKGPKVAKVKLRLISAQWARMNESKFQADLPDMLVVDEAHAARVHMGPYGTKTTRLWHLIDSVKDDIPHLVLVTATPMQVHASEYHGLLKLLGLPKPWQKFSNYEESLKVIGNEVSRIQLNEAKVIADLLLTSFEEFSWVPTLLTNKESVLIMELRQSYEVSKHAPAIKVQGDIKQFISILTKIHPAHFLTSRNTKSGLEKFGYKFPTRHFEAPKIIMNGFLEKYEFAVESYLSNAYGKTEESLKPAGRFPIGFAKSGYYQRLVSSLYASRSTLNKRRDKLQQLSVALTSFDAEIISKILSNFDLEDEEVQKDEYMSLIVKAPRGAELQKVIQSVQKTIELELMYIDELLAILAKLGSDIEAHDPKFAVALDIIENEVNESSILVFSRYTDTLEGFLKLFEAHPVSKQISGFALYTGGEAWIKTQLGKIEASKTDVTDALHANHIAVVFCSDAASEGLNLQAAKTLINLDVPWNPARLEQRIGRVARLGQRSPIVDIYNLWYPESIEAKMYTRLLNRIGDYELAVGEAADIFSDAIKLEIAARFTGEETRAENMFAQLQQVRNDFQRLALQKIWQNSEDLPPASTLLREDILKALKHVDLDERTSKYSENLTPLPGNRNSFTLLHPSLDEIANYANIHTPTRGADLCGFIHKGLLCALGIIDSQNRYSLLRVMSLGRLIQSIVGISELDTDDFFSINIEKGALANNLRLFTTQESNIPNHNLARVPFQGIVGSIQDNDFEDVEIRVIGKVSTKCTS